MFVLRDINQTPFVNVDGPNRFNGTTRATPHLIDINGTPSLFINGQKTILFPNFSRRTAIDTKWYSLNPDSNQYEFVPDQDVNNPVRNIPKGWIGGHATFADFDGDGNSELIWSFYNGLMSFSEEAQYFQLDENGIYQEVANPFSEVNLARNFQRHVAIDLDFDNDLDVLFQNADTKEITAYRNNGGTFTLLQNTPNLGIPLDNLEKVYSFDWEGDGDFDVVKEDTSGNFSFYLNQKGAYNLQSGANNPFADLNAADFNATFGDTDGDGDIDAVFLDNQGKVVFYENTMIDGEPEPTVDTLSGSNDDDTIRGSNNDEVILGLDGNDLLLSLDGNDTISGGNGNDRIFGGGNDDLLLGDAGKDALNGGSGNDSLSGGENRDTLNGGAGNDVLFGDGDRDILRGGDGSDVFRGGAGNDVFVGGAGSDFFILEVNQGRDFIRDFTDNIDKLVLTNGVTVADLNISNNAAGTATIIRDDTNSAVAILKNVDASLITPEDFVVV